MESDSRKPLLFQGARQVGKTWLLNEFGRTCFQNIAYINFDKDESAKRIFEHDFSIERIITALQLHCGHPITPGKTLIILDEIQEAPRAVTCLKYFCEDAPQYHVAAAGSYLGVASLTRSFSRAIGRMQVFTRKSSSTICVTIISLAACLRLSILL